MAKYHVGKDGQARPCKAASPDSCPLAKADGSGVVKHFDSLDAAQSYGERVAMGLVGEDSSHAAPVAGMRDDGHYVDDTGHVYPKEGEEWSDDDRAAYVQRAIRETLVLYEDDPAFDDLKSIAAGEWDWGDIRRECRALTDYGQYKEIDRWWDALDSKCPVLDVDGNIRVAKDSDRVADRVAPVAGSATDDEISEYVRSANANALRNDVSIVSSVDVLDGCRRFDAATAEEKALIRESLDRADAAVASGDFEAAADEYETAAKRLGYKFNDFRTADPVLERLRNRWFMADFAVDDGFSLSMEDLPNDRRYDEERELEPGTFSITKDGVIPLDLDDDDDEYDDDDDEIAPGVIF